MTIERKHTGARMSQIVIRGDTVYLAGQVAEDAADFAEASPVPGPEELYSNVWAEINPSGRLFFDGRDR